MHVQTTFASKIFFLKHYGHIGKTCRHFKERVSKYQGVSPRTNETIKINLSTFVKDHILSCDHKAVHESFRFLGNEFLTNIYRNQKKVYSLKYINYHLKRTYTRRSY